MITLDTTKLLKAHNEKHPKKPFNNKAELAKAIGLGEQSLSDLQSLRKDKPKWLVAMSKLKDIANRCGLTLDELITDE
jgi:hypothetical protein